MVLVEDVDVCGGYNECKTIALSPDGIVSNLEKNLLIIVRICQYADDSKTHLVDRVTQLA